MRHGRRRGVRQLEELQVPSPVDGRAYLGHAQAHQDSSTDHPVQVPRLAPAGCAQAMGERPESTRRPEPPGSKGNRSRLIESQAAQARRRLELLLDQVLRLLSIDKRRG